MLRPSVLVGIAVASSSVLLGVAWDATRGASYGKWVRAGEMRLMRQDHTMVRLADGRVMAVGGGHNCSPEAARNGEVWDPNTNTWTLTGTLSARRVGSFSATALEDGGVLVAGGSSGGERTTDVAEVWDPTTNRWTKTSSLANRRGGHVAVALADGRVLVAGGWSRGKPLGSTEIWDPKTRRWTPSGDLHQPRAVATAVRMKDGRVAIAGGHVEGVKDTTPEVWDPATGEWTQLDEPKTCTGTRVARTPDGKFVVVIWATRSIGRPPSGRTMRFDPMTGAIEDLPRIDEGRDRPSISTLPSGEVVMAGGGYDVREEPGFLEKMEANGEEIPPVVVERYLDETLVLAPGDTRWREAVPLHDARSHHSSVVLLDGTLLVTGGIGDHGTLRTTERWLPTKH